MKKAEINSFVDAVFKEVDLHNSTAMHGGPSWAIESIHQLTQQCRDQMRRVMYMAIEVGDKDPDAPLPVITNITLQ
jgi:hypothetical protein